MLDHWDSYKSALRDLAEVEELTIVVGAGASLQSGLPTWRELVKRLLRVGAKRQGLKGAEIDGYAEWVINSDDLIPAASVARHMLGEDFEQALRDALYQRIESVTPGEMARAIAAIRIQLDHRSEIATTNYDALLEAAVVEAVSGTGGTRPKAVSLVDGTPAQPGEIGVRHLHGLLKPKANVRGKLVLSEADYHAMQQAEQWQEHYFEERLASGRCLFTGASLTDPNLLRYLYRSKGGRRHYAIFARQQDSGAYQKAPPAVRAVRERTAEERWGNMGINPVQFDHYSELPQFLWEVAARRRLGSSYLPLETRLMEWDAWATRTLLTRSGRKFTETQDRLHHLLQDALHVLTTHGGRDGPAPLRDERLQCSLWLFRPREDALINIGSSDRVWRDRATLQPVPIAWHSDFAAIQAFCSGATVSHVPDKHTATRWRHILGQALYARSGWHGCLPVGVVTWASTASPDRSFLQKARTQEPDLLDALGNVLAFMLSRADS